MVRKRVLSLVLAAMLTVLYPAAAFAESTESTGAESEKDKESAVTEVKYLSLDDAIEIMTTSGTRAETAELNKESDTAVANGYSENYKNISDGLDTIDAAGSQSVSAQQIIMQYHLNASSATDLVLASTIANVTNQTIYDSIKAARDSGVSNTNKNIMKERRSSERFSFCL